MAIAATAVWRTRISGVNTNGGGYDCSISTAASGTNGSFTGTTFTDATAAAFTSGMANRSINIAGIGQYLITAFISATQVTLGSGNPALTLAGPLTWSVGAGTDYSQQNTAQATGTNGATSGAGSTTFTDATAAAFTAAMVGNAIFIASGTNFQAGPYFVTSFTNANSVVLDRTPSSGGAGSAGVWKLGGGWADFWTNAAASLNYIVPGNTIYILGSGTPNPSSYTIDYNAIDNQTVSGNATAGAIIFAGDPATPGYKAVPDTTGGMPTIRIAAANNVIFDTINNFELIGLWFIGITGAVSLTTVVSSVTAVGCVFDQRGFDISFLSTNNTCIAVGCECFSSVAGSGSNAQFFGTDIYIISCNIHDTLGVGINCQSSYKVVSSIVAKNGGDGIQLTGGNATLVQNCTIDGNGGHGITISSQSVVAVCKIFNNIISNQTTAGKFGLTVAAGTATQNSAISAFVNYNIFYNNTANYNAIFGGAHDTLLGVTPYVGSATENYTLA